jgi:hypothetical protein
MNKPHIRSLDELLELWPDVLAHMKRRIGVVAVAYLSDARPTALDNEEVVLEYQRKFRYEKAVEVSLRLPFEQVLNECLATPHRLRFQLTSQSDTQ